MPADYYHAALSMKGENYSERIENLNDNELTKNVVNQSQRWARLKNKIRNNTIDSDKEQIESNKINEALLEIIEAIEIEPSS